MREIKFRIFDKDFKKMLYQNDSIPGTEKDEIYAPAWGRFNDALEEMSDDKNVILMQFTGLLDRNGKEIYEGDLLYYHPSDMIGGTKGKVNFNKGAFIFDLPNGSFFFVNQVARNSKVIGNIYEHTDLL